MKKLDVFKARVIEGKTAMIHHRYNTEDANNDSSGIWWAFGDLTPEEVLAYAKMHTDPDIEITVKTIA